MQAWKLTAGMGSGKGFPPAAVPPVDPVTIQTFETDATPFTGAWVRTTEWAKNGSYSLGRSNKAVQSSTSTGTFAATLATAVKIEFDWWVQGEGSDRFGVSINGKSWTLDQSGITDPAQFVVQDGKGTVGSTGGIGGHATFMLDPGAYVINFNYVKDSSVDIGLDGAFIDNFTTTTYANAIVTPPADATYFTSFESDVGTFTGSWRQDSKWKKDGSLSLGSTNQGVPSSNSDAELNLTLPGTGIYNVDFDFYVQGETSDGIWAWINSNLWAMSRIAPNTPGEAVPYEAGKVRSATGFQGKWTGTVPAGAFNLKVRFSKDNSGDSGLDQGFIDNVYIRPYVKPTPPGATYFEDFEGGVGSFTGDWVISELWSTSGSKSLSSSKKGVASSTSITTYTTTMATSGNITFDLMTQGEAGYDGVLVTVNGANWSADNFTKTSGGTANWREGIRLTCSEGIAGTVNFPVAAGDVTVTISYIKDTSGDVGLDAGFIDNFAVIPGAVPPSVSFVAASATAIVAANESLSTPMPAGIQAGDRLIAMVFARFAQPDIAGWTVYDKINHDDVANSINQTMYAYTKVCEAGDIGGTFSIAADTGRRGVVITAYRKTGGTPAILGSAKVLTGNTDPLWYAPPITSSGPGQMAVCGGTWILTNNVGTVMQDDPWVLDSAPTTPDTGNAMRIMSMHQVLATSGITTSGGFGLVGTGMTAVAFVNLLLG